MAVVPSRSYTLFSSIDNHHHVFAVHLGFRLFELANSTSNSTIARSFSQELVDIFRIENSLTDLDQQVTTKSVIIYPNYALHTALTVLVLQERTRQPKHPRAGLS